MHARPDGRAAQDTAVKIAALPDRETDEFARRRTRLSQLLGRLLAHDWLRRRQHGQEPTNDGPSEHRPPMSRA